MRGEYKVPGGKLVAAEVEVDGDRISRVFVQGDFFLEPDEALEDINAALIPSPSPRTPSNWAGPSRPRCPRAWR